MRIQNHSKAIDIILSAVPVATSLRDFDVSKDGVIYFKYKSELFKVTLESCFTELIENGCGIYNNQATFLEALIKRTALNF
jgi:hypothetical protein